MLVPGIPVVFDTTFNKLLVQRLENTHAPFQYSLIRKLRSGLGINLTTNKM